MRTISEASGASVSWTGLEISGVSVTRSDSMTSGTSMTWTGLETSGASVTWMGSEILGASGMWMGFGKLWRFWSSCGYHDSEGLWDDVCGFGDFGGFSAIDGL